jgi:TP901 family phage tail tape measure protein
VAKFGNADAFFKAGLVLQAENSMGEGINQAEQQMSGLEARAAVTSRKLRGLGDTMTSIGGSMLAGGTALAAPLVGAATSFAEFESRMNRSIAVFDDVTSEMRDQMAERAREISELTKGMVASEEAAEGFEFLASAGLEAEQAIAAIEPTARFSQAAQVNLSEATSRLTNAQSALGLSVEDPTQNMENMRRVSDALVGAYQSADATIDQFSEALTNKAAARLRSMNVEVEEGTALLAGFADQGIKGRKAGERLNILLRDLPKAARENSQAFEQMGISLFDAEGELRDGADIIGQFEDAVGDLPPQQREAALAQLGLNQRVSDSLTTLLGTSKKIRQFEKDIRDSTGATEELAKSQEEGLKVAFGNVTEQVDNLGEVLGGMTSGPLVSLLNRTAGAIKGTREWAKANEELASTLVQGTGIVAGLGIVLGGTVSALGFFLKGIANTIEFAPKAWKGIKKFASGMKTAAASLWRGVKATGAWIASQVKSLLASLANAGGMRALASAAAGKIVKGMKAAAAATKAFTVSLLTNPVTLVAAAAAGAAILIIKHWEPIKKFFVGLWGDVKPYLQPVLDWFGSLGPKIQNMWDTVGPILSTAWDKVSGLVKGIGNLLGLGGEEANVGMNVETPELGSDAAVPDELTAGLQPGNLSVTPERFDEMEQGVPGGEGAQQGAASDEVTAGLQLGNLDMTSQQAGQMQQGMPGGEGGQQGSPQQFVREAPGRTQQERPQPAAPITVNNEVNVEINGDADADEVREGVEAGNEDLERRMQRVLNEEHRTGF